MIYLRLRGRIGNQLFMYAVARKIQLEMGENTPIIIDDFANHDEKYENSLIAYDLHNTKFVADRRLLFSIRYIVKIVILKMFRLAEKNMTFEERYIHQKRWQGFLNFCGIILCDDGYIDYSVLRKNILIEGYFQSEKYFATIKSDLIQTFYLKEEDVKGYPHYEKIVNGNTICISVKVQHNTDNPMYDVCTKKYWQSAIAYLSEKVDEPIFFVCSDDVEYVKENLIDTNKFCVIEQEKDIPIQISLAVMARCKHFIIGNTSFGWWAQYLCKNPEKIVVAPSKWYGIDVPCEIYDQHWIHVEE